MFPPQQKGRKAEQGVQGFKPNPLQAEEKEPPTVMPRPPGVCERLCRSADSGPEIALPSSTPDEPTHRESSGKNCLRNPRGNNNGASNS